MANSSNKNFPHAYGAGRVIAAFSLSHPGGTVGNTQGDYFEGAGNMLVRPPAFTDPTLVPQFPYPFPSSGPSGFGWTPDRQPYNATSLGVYVTGSGTRRLPYRDALGLEVPAGVGAALNRAWPSNGLYPFSTVDQTALGSTHAQVVCSVVNDEDPELGEVAYYEVGLNWDLPPYRITAPPGGGPADNFANAAIASLRRSLARTFWVTASLNSDALSEAHPDVDWGPDGPVLQNIESGPVAGVISSLGFAGPAGAAYAAPYFDFFGGPLLPSQYPVTPAEDLDFFQQPAVVQAQVSAIMTNFDQRELPSGAVELIIRVAPIVRVWLQVPCTPDSEVNTPTVGPRPLPRFGLNPYQPDQPDESDASLPPAINVQVMQKNSSAPDGTDTAVYDLFQQWEQLGGGPSAPSRLSSRKTTDPEPLGDRVARALRVKKEKT